MNVRWLEMPVSYSGDTGRSVGPKYAVQGDAVVLYRNDRAYVGIARADIAAGLADHPDVYPVSSANQLHLGQTVTLRSMEHLLKGTSGHVALARAADRIGLGDALSAITRRLGIRECRGCARRRRVFNRFTMRNRRQPPGGQL